MANSTPGWEQRSVVAELVFVVARATPILGAIGAGLAVSRLVSHPAHLGSVAWWVAIAASATLTFKVLQYLARRALTLAALLDMTVPFSAQPPSRLVVALHASSVRKLQARLGRTYEPNASAARVSECLAIATAIQALRMTQLRNSSVVFRVGNNETMARVIESEIPGLFEIVPMNSPKRPLMIFAAAVGIAALVTSVTLGTAGPSPRSGVPTAAGFPPTPTAMPATPGAPAAPTPITAGPAPVPGPEPPPAVTTPPATPTISASPPSPTIPTGAPPATASGATDVGTQLPQPVSAAAQPATTPALATPTPTTTAPAPSPVRTPTISASPPSPTIPTGAPPATNGEPLDARTAVRNGATARQAHEPDVPQDSPPRCQRARSSLGAHDED